MSTTPQPSPQDINDAIRRQILQMAYPVTKQIFNQAVNPANQNAPINVQAQPVGLVTSFTVIVSGNVQNSHASQDSVSSPYGVANVLSLVDLQDLQSLHRITTGGWHLMVLDTEKKQYPANAASESFIWENPGAFPSRTTVGQWGANWPVIQDPSSIQHGTTVPFRMVYEVPVSYSKEDLRGAIYANVAQAYVQLYLTLNPAAQAFVAAGADDTFAMQSGGTLAFVGNVTIQVYQNYLDQLPTVPAGNGQQGGVLLPPIDIATVYELKQSRFNAIAAGQDFPLSYTSFRDFLSLNLIYNNNGSSTGHGVGADLNYLKLQTANSAPIYQLDPFEFTRRTRLLLTTDPPPGHYYVSHRTRPISVLTSGNMQFIINPITAGAGAYLQVGWEDFALSNQLTQAPSLASAGGM
jgi:hypothetical protein